MTAVWIYGAGTYGAGTYGAGERDVPGRYPAHWEGTMNSARTFAVLQVLLCLIALGLLAWMRSDALAFGMFGPSDVVKLLTPLVLASAFIERAVEVIISPWRDSEADRLTTQLHAVRVVSTAGDEPTADRVSNIVAAKHALTDYRGQTQRYAFLISLGLGLIASLAGVRTIRPFLQLDALNHLNFVQRDLFVGFDVLLTGALLAGGADGLHSMISAITCFFNATSERVSNQTSVS